MLSENALHIKKMSRPINYSQSLEKIWPRFQIREVVKTFKKVYEMTGVGMF